LTINGAITYINANPFPQNPAIWVMPGTYTEASFTIPANIAIRGHDTQTVTISPSSYSSNLIFITMSENTRLEDVTVTLTTGNAIDMTAIYFPSTTSTSAKMRTMVVNVTYTGNNTNNIYGVLAGGTSTNPQTTYYTANAIRATTINVTCNSVITAKGRGIYITGACNFTARDTNISVSGTARDLIGVENTNTGAFVQLKQCSVSGLSSVGTTSYDIKQPALLNNTNSTLQLSGTDLINANADANGFTVNTDPAHIFFAIVNSNFNSSGPKYLTPGSQNFTNTSGSVLGINFAQKVVIFELELAVISPENTATVTITLYKTTTPYRLAGATTIGSLTLNVTARPPGGGNFATARKNNFSASFAAQTDFLLVAFSSTANLGGTDLLSVSIATY
jgi:hypothetical protein